MTKDFMVYKAVMVVYHSTTAAPSTALRLAKFFGMSSDFWLNLQLSWDLYHVQKQEGEVIQQVQVLIHFVLTIRIIKARPHNL
jgi:plasmid maintenance system antidote protein VapI